MDAHADEYNTQHDRKPTRTARPDWLEQAQAAMVNANKVERETIDAWEEGRPGITWEAKELAIQQAEAAFQMYLDCYAMNERGETPASIELKLDTLISL